MLSGTDDPTLNRALGHIQGTAQPGTKGNLGIAGHRDGFFRGFVNLLGSKLYEAAANLYTSIGQSRLAGVSSSRLPE